MTSLQVYIEDIWVSGETVIQSKMLILSYSYMKGTLTTFIKLANVNPRLNQFTSNLLCSYRILIESCE
jgi:hypothetical protein